MPQPGAAQVPHSQGCWLWAGHCSSGPPRVTASTPSPRELWPPRVNQGEKGRGQPPGFVAFPQKL